MNVVPSSIPDLEVGATPLGRTPWTGGQAPTHGTVESTQYRETLTERRHT